MNKKRSKNNNKDQRRSKDTKWVRPKGYYCRYERERGGGDKRIRTKIKALLTLLNDTYELRSATGKRMISYLICLVDRVSRPLVPPARLVHRITPRLTALDVG